MRRLFGLVTLAVFLCVPFAASAGVRRSLACSAQGPFQNRTDGLCHSADDYGPGLVVNGSFDSMFNSALYNAVDEDFLGFFIIGDVDTADASQPIWTSQDTGTAGCPARKGDYDSGAVELLLDNGSEVGDCALYWGDEQNIDSDTEPFCYFRIQYQTAPAAADTLYWGLVSGYNALIESATQFAVFTVKGADNNLGFMSDDNTTDVAETDTTVDMTAGTFIETIISLNSMHGATTGDTNGASATDVHAFYRTSLGGSWTQVLPDTTFSVGADVALQPIVGVEKTNGTTVPDLLVDRVACFWKRS